MLTSHVSPAHIQGSEGEAYPNSALGRLTADHLRALGFPRDASADMVFTNTVPEKDGFWRRQFGTAITAHQIGFDIFFGAVLPSICFFFDPIVFRGSGGLLPNFTVFAHVGSYLASMGLLASLVFGDRLGWLRAPLGGLFSAAAVTSLFLGTCLLPFSIIGIAFYLVGLLGLSPFLFSLVMLRNAVRSMRSAEAELSSAQLISVVFSSAALSIAVSWSLDQTFSRIFL